MYILALAGVEVTEMKMLMIPTLRKIPPRNGSGMWYYGRCQWPAYKKWQDD
jgi:hypothetical protein